MTATVVDVPDVAPAADPPVPRRGAIRIRRSLLLLIPTGLAALILAIGTLMGYVPLNLAFSGQNVKLTSNGKPAYAPKGLSGYPNTLRMKNGGPIVGSKWLTIPEADLPEGVCISLVVKLPIVGEWTVQIATHGDTVVKDMTLKASDVHVGEATLRASTTDGKAPKKDQSNVEANVVIGVSADEIGGGSDHAGGFGLTAPGAATLNKLQVSAQGGTVAGTAKLSRPGVSIGHGHGTEHSECY